MFCRLFPAPARHKVFPREFCISMIFAQGKYYAEKQILLS